MNCKHVTALLSPWMEGELSEASHLQVRAHLDTCPACDAEYAALQRVVALLQNDAAAPQPAIPDLYATFQQRLVTQPVKASFWGGRNHRVSRTWLLPRLAVGLVGAGCVASAIKHKFFRYNAAEQTLMSAAYNLSLPHPEEPMHITEIRRTRTPEGSERTRLFHTWWHRGYSYARVLDQTSSADENRLPTASEFVLSCRYGTPGGTMLQWGPERANKTVRLEWIPSNPAQPTNGAIQYDAGRYAVWCRQIVEHGKTAQAHVEEESTPSIPDQYSVHIDDLKAGLGRLPTPSYIVDVPDALTLWFNKQGYVEHYQEGLRASGKELLEDTFIAYPQYPIPQLTAPDVPRNRPVALAYKLPVNNPLVPPERLVKPVWLTMREEEKDEVRHTIKLFAEMWRAHNVVRLRTMVDTERLLEITRPDKRAGLTGEDIWQRAWLDHLRRQPSWQYFTINVDFAFEAAPRLFDTVPLDVNEWNLDHALPGLNVLAWVNAQQADGQEYKTGVRLYLVKRPTGWKVVQFGQLRSGDSSIP